MHCFLLDIRQRGVIAHSYDRSEVLGTSKPQWCWWTKRLHDRYANVTYIGTYVTQRQIEYVER